MALWPERTLWVASSRSRPRGGVSLVSAADSLDTRSAAGRLVLNIMVSVSQWEREAIGECRAGGFTLADMHSTNGTRVNDCPIDGKVIVLRPYDRISVGEVNFVFKLH